MIRPADLEVLESYACRLAEPARHTLASIEADCARDECYGLDWARPALKYLVAPLHRVIDEADRILAFVARAREGKADPVAVRTAADAVRRLLDLREAA